jgi:tRNA-Thr(GGU) m(6)t(6)A37 methyltransferase TsaA
MPHYTFEPIGFINSCFKEKFGIPRQPGIVPSAAAVLEMEPQFSHMEAFRRLETFSHVWLLFVFHQSSAHQWKPTVRPPRLGGNQRVGVFASRSNFRPNAIGQSVVKLLSINKPKEKIELELGGVDLLHGTPVLDIKPYLPYSDAIFDATPGYAHDPPKALWPVIFSPAAIKNGKRFEQTRYPGLMQVITDLLALDPRPGYQKKVKSHNYGMRLWDLNITFQFDTDQIVVEGIDDMNLKPAQ